MATDGKIQVVFCWIRPGWMYPCLTQARKTIDASCKRLFTEIPDIEIGIIAHGDYCDKAPLYVTKIHDLSDDADSICRSSGPSGRPAAATRPECYELVLHEARSLRWSKGAAYRSVLVIIGDDVPTPRENPKQLNWRDEMTSPPRGRGLRLRRPGPRPQARDPLLQEIAEESGGVPPGPRPVRLHHRLILAICFKQAGDEKPARLRERGRRARPDDRSLNRPSIR